MASSPKRTASAPWRSISSIGSMPLPSDLDMRRPSGASSDRVDVHVGEGHLAHELEAHHHHARHPQEDDVAGGGVDVGGVEGLELGGLLGPARVAKGHRAEENHVSSTSSSWVTGRRRTAAGGRAHLDDGHLVGLAVVDGQAVAPPQLARDHPRADVLHPSR